MATIVSEVLTNLQNLTVYLEREMKRARREAKRQEAKEKQLYKYAGAVGIAISAIKTHPAL